MLKDMNLKSFLDTTISDAPVPGGGSVAALSGALAAALSGMVANLTIGKKKYADFEAPMKEVLERMSVLKDELLEDIDRDAKAFDGVMACFKMPKETDEDKKNRKEAMQKAFKEASEVPFEVAKKCIKIMDEAEYVVVNGNKNAVTDGAVSAMMARTACLSALYNVRINLSSIKDEEYKNNLEKEVEILESLAKERETAILSLVKL
jgi:formiminotetrahydrofolate cyclodeaminase